MSIQIICPQPGVWNDIHKALLNAKKERGDSSIPDPPIPLILAGWWASSDEDKRERWINTLKWAEQYGFIHLIPKMTDGECYFG